VVKIRQKDFVVPDDKATITTIKLIGEAIKKGATYLPIRNYAAALATDAPPKDYLGQLKNIYQDILKRWRYVRDPHGTELLARSPEALYNLILGHKGGVGKGKGAGDCDDITAALGACLKSIGFPVLLVTSAPPAHRLGANFTHIFLVTEIPNRGSIYVDPVLYPYKGLGEITPHSRLVVWNLDGQWVAAKGIKPKTLSAVYGKGA
jgi:hypothetical protein